MSHKSIKELFVEIAAPGTRKSAEELADRIGHWFFLIDDGIAEIGNAVELSIPLNGAGKKRSAKKKGARNG